MIILSANAQDKKENILPILQKGDATKHSWLTSIPCHFVRIIFHSSIRVSRGHDGVRQRASALHTPYSVQCAPLSFPSELSDCWDFIPAPLSGHFRMAGSTFRYLTLRNHSAEYLGRWSRAPTIYHKPPPPIIDGHWDLLLLFLACRRLLSSQPVPAIPLFFFPPLDAPYYIIRVVAASPIPPEAIL